MNKQTKEIVQISVLVFIILLAVIITGLARKSFKLPAAEALKKTQTTNYFLSGESLQTLMARECLIVQLDSSKIQSNTNGISIVLVQPSALQSKKNKELLSERKKIILFSNDVDKSARTWLWLIQQGYAQVYILENDSLSLGSRPINEQLRYTFKADTSQL